MWLQVPQDLWSHGMVSGQEHSLPEDVHNYKTRSEATRSMRFFRTKNHAETFRSLVLQYWIWCWKWLLGASDIHIAVRLKCVGSR